MDWIIKITKILSLGYLLKILCGHYVQLICLSGSVALKFRVISSSLIELEGKMLTLYCCGINRHCMQSVIALEGKMLTLYCCGINRYCMQSVIALEGKMLTLYCCGINRHCRQSSDSIRRQNAHTLLLWH